MHRLHTLQRSTHQQLKRLEAKLAAAVEKNPFPVDEQIHEDLCNIVAAQSPYIESTYPPGSFQWLFWEQQKQANACADARSMRWHPLMIKWCVYLRHLSSSAYETLRDSGCVVLPSQRTLRDYTHYVPAVIGFSAASDKQLFEAANISDCQEWEKYVVLILDEMHIKEDLVFDKHTGKLWLISVFCTIVQFLQFSCFRCSHGIHKLGPNLEEGGSLPSTTSKFQDGVYGSRPLHPTSVPLCTVFLRISVRRPNLRSLLGGCLPAWRWWIHMPQTIAICIFFVRPTTLAQNDKKLLGKQEATAMGEFQHHIVCACRLLVPSNGTACMCCHSHAWALHDR